MVMNLADWETLPYDSFSPHRTLSPRAFPPFTSYRRCSVATDCSGEYAYAARLPTQFSPRHALVMKKGQRLSRDALRTQRTAPVIAMLTR